MSKSITVKSSNNQTISINTNDNATVKQILGSTEVLTFFGKSQAEICGALSGINGTPVSAALSQYLLMAAPEDNSIIEINFSVAAFGASATAAPAPVPGTVTVKWNGGSYSLDLQGIPIGVATVRDVINNPLVGRRFGLSATQLSACDIMLEDKGSAHPLTQTLADITKVSNGSVVWLQSRAADDKGNRD